MSEIVKRTSTNYRIDAGDNDVNLNATTVTVYGNLVVVGNSTTVESTNTLVADNIITLQAAPGGNPLLNAGIEVDRGSEPMVGLRFNEDTDHWEYTNDGTLWKWIWTELYDDKSPVLGSDLDVNDFAIEPGPSGNIEIGPIFKVPQLTTSSVTGLINSPVSVPLVAENDYTLLYAKPAENGNAGLFVTNHKVSDQELVTKRKAFLFSIIF